MIAEVLRSSDLKLKSVYASGSSRRLPATVAAGPLCPFVPESFSALEPINALRAAGIEVVQRRTAVTVGAGFGGRQTELSDLASCY